MAYCTKYDNRPNEHYLNFGGPLSFTYWTHPYLPPVICLLFLKYSFKKILKLYHSYPTNTGSSWSSYGHLGSYYKSTSSLNFPINIAGKDFCLSYYCLSEKYCELYKYLIIQIQSLWAGFMLKHYFSLDRTNFSDGIILSYLIDSRTQQILSTLMSSRFREKY